MWNELETLVRAHAGDSPGHQRVLDCLLACRSSKPTEEDERKKGKRKKEEREERAERSGLRDPDAETDRCPPTAALFSCPRACAGPSGPCASLIVF